MPFPIGTTYWQGATPPDATSGVEWEGREFVVEDLDYSSSPFKPRAYGNQITYKTVRIVRNVGSFTMLPKRLASFKTTAYGRQVDGYATTTAAEGYPIDEFLISTGVVNNDLFYIVVDGPATVLTDPAVSSNNTITAGSTILVALTAVTSQSTTAGRIAPQDLTGATSLLALQVQNRIGIALTGITSTGNTANSILAMVKKW